MSNIDGLILGHWNVITLFSKFDEICNTLISKQMHVLYINETRLDSTILDHNIAIPGYSLIRKDRNRCGGGVAICILDKIMFNVQEELMDSSKEMIWVKLKTDHVEPFLLACLYRAPSVSQKDYFSDITEILVKACNLNMEIVLMGDLNVDCSLNNFNSHNKLYQLCQLFDFSQLVKGPTRVTENTSTVIDVILSTMPQMHIDTYIDESSMSDHYLVYTVLNYSAPTSYDTLICRTFKNLNESMFLNELRTSLVCVMPLENLNDMPLSDAWEIFKNVFINICNKHALVRKYKVKSVSKPWISNEIIELKVEINGIKELSKLNVMNRVRVPVEMHVFHISSIVL